MSENRYQAVVNGQLTGNVSLEQAKANIAKIFNTPVQKIEPLFSGKRLVIKQGITEEAARQYESALIKAGLQCFVEEMTPPSDAPAANAAAATATTSAGSGLDKVDIAPPGSIIIEQQPVKPPDIDTTQYSLGQPGEILVEAKAVATADIDTSTLNLAPVGSDLGQSKQTPPPPPDPGDLKLE